jgi:MYXO-CTERM domain-containing protein
MLDDQHAAQAEADAALVKKSSELDEQQREAAAQLQVEAQTDRQKAEAERLATQQRADSQASSGWVMALLAVGAYFAWRVLK